MIRSEFFLANAEDATKYGLRMAVATSVSEEVGEIVRSEFDGCVCGWKILVENGESSVVERLRFRELALRFEE